MHTAMQDIMPIHCFGCGALNEHGLQIKSFWLGEEAVCAWRPKAHHIGHPGILYGGMIASAVDCHCIWTAMADAHRRAGIEMDGTPRFAFVTGTLSVRYRNPVPIEQAIELRARVAEARERKTVVRCTVSCRGTLCAEAELVAVRVATETATPPSWSASSGSRVVAA